MLARAAADFWNEERARSGGIPARHITLEGPPEETGEAYFFIYALDEHSANRKRTLETVVVLDDGRLAPETAKTLLVQLQNGVCAPSQLNHDEGMFIEAQKQADAWIAHKRDAVEHDARQRNEALIRVRSASIKASFDAKIRRTSAYLEQATDTRIQRLRRGELRNLEAKRLAKLQELDQTRQVTASYACVALGRALITEKTGNGYGSETLSTALAHGDDSPDAALHEVIRETPSIFQHEPSTKGGQDTVTISESERPTRFEQLRQRLAGRFKK
jgi:hypothetical protein